MRPRSSHLSPVHDRLTRWRHRGRRDLRGDPGGARHPGRTARQTPPTTACGLSCTGAPSPPRPTPTSYARSCCRAPATRSNAPASLVAQAERAGKRETGTRAEPRAGDLSAQPRARPAVDGVDEHAQPAVRTAVEFEGDALQLEVVAARPLGGKRAGPPDPLRGADVGELDR